MNETPQHKPNNDQSLKHAIAIIGMAGRFPGAENCNKFWENLCLGKESISHFTLDELQKANVDPDLLKSPYYIKARGILNDVSLFDADFFGMSVAEAQVTDPQQRLFLECAWESLENAGYSSDQYDGNIGVYGGCGINSYYINNIHPNQKIQSTVGSHLIHIGNEKDYLSTRVSYKLNLTGPSLTIQTACSTSLTAVSIACNHLLSYQCDMALAGGSTIAVPQKSGYLYQQDMIFSSDGHCRPFDEKANGTLPGNGVGVVLLKRLEEAVSDRDHIYAVIRGYGINNDGKEKVSYTAPSLQGQANAIDAALTMAEVDPETISYIETHGTATFLGDLLEISALSQAFRLYTQKKQFCAIGSVKSNLGHLFETAGIAGLIKTTLGLYHSKIPPSLHFNNPNPNIDFESSPFYVNQSLQEWKQAGHPKRAGISSFGFGGTNVHLILEEAPQLPVLETPKKEHLLVLSARTPTALKTISRNLSHYLKEHTDISLDDLAYTLQIGRKVFDHRMAIICHNREDAIKKLSNNLPIKELPNTALALIGKKWVTEGLIDWLKLYKGLLPRRIPLPTYPFEKKHFWVEPLSVDNNIDQPPLPTIENSLPDIEKNILKIWQNFFELKSISLQDDFFQLGGDSLLAIQIIDKIREQFNITLKMSSFFEFPTVSHLAKFIFQKSEPISINENIGLPPLLVQLKAGNGKAPLFFVHPIGGHVFCYKQLAEGLKYEGPIFGIQGPCFTEENPKYLKTIEEIASYYIQSIKKIQAIGPYHLIGASFGGAVAYEIARQLKEQNFSVALLAMLDTGRLDTMLKKKNDKTKMLSFLIELFDSKPLTLGSLTNLSEKDQIKRLMTSFGLEHLNPSMQEKVFEQVTTNWNALLKYKPKSYSGKILFFQAKDKFFRYSKSGLETAWENLAQEGIESYEIIGNHMSIMAEPGVLSIQTILNSYLEKKEKS